MAQPEALSLRTNMLWSSVGSITRLVCNYLVGVAVVRLSHGFDAAGALALVMAIANLINPFADYRLRTIQVTDTKGERSAGEYVGLRVLTTALAFLIGIVYSLVTASFDALPLIAMYLVYSLATNFIEVLHAIDQRHRRMDYIGKSYILQGVTTLAGFCVVLWLANSLMAAIVAMAVVTILVGVVYDVPRSAQFERLRPVIDLRPAMSLLVTLFPLVIAQVCSSSVLTLPRQYLESSVGSEALGIYNSVASPVVIVQMGAVYVYSPLMGEFADRFHSDKRSALTLLWRTIGGILVVTAVAAALLLLLGDPVLRLIFGDKIIGHTDLLLPAIVCTVMTAFAWFMNDLLIAVRDLKASFLGNALAALASLVSMKVLVDAFGMNGVSWVGVLSYSLAVALLALFLARDYRRLGSERGGSPAQSSASSAKS